MPKGESKNRQPRSHSGKVGGPSTARGLTYQLDYAVSQCLSLISIAKNCPHKQVLLGLEPRSLAASAITTWDIFTTPPDRFAEVKLRPSRADVLEFVARANSTPTASTLAFSEHGTASLRTLDRLIALAAEAGRDSERFAQLVRVEANEGASDLLQALGPLPQAVLQRVNLECKPEAAIASLIKLFSERLAGGDGAELVRVLREKFFGASTTRAQLDINDLIAELEGTGIRLYAPAETTLLGEPRQLIEAMFLLQRCQSPIPAGVLARAVGFEEVQLIEALSPLIEQRIVYRDGDALRIVPRATQVTVADYADLVARGIEALIHYVKVSHSIRVPRGYVMNVVELAHLCVSRPGAVISVFAALQRTLKALGDKHLVLEVADLCIDAANRLHNDEDAARAKALALICGRSWVYQRVDRIDKARCFAEESLALGTAIGWDRNTAFCTKCIGRLLRLEAKRTEDSCRRQELLRESEIKLVQAIRLFEALPPSEKGDREVADCYSLLGRTHFVAGNREEAERCVAIAFERMPVDEFKDMMDLQILAGELQSWRNNLDAADSLFTEVLASPYEDDHEMSEIRARAFFQRAANNEKSGRVKPAVADYVSAKEIWTALREPEPAAESEWYALKASKRIHPTAVARLLSEPVFRVRLRTIQLYNAAVGKRTAASAHRSAPPDAKLVELQREAARQVAVELYEW